MHIAPQIWKCFQLLLIRFLHRLKKNLCYLFSHSNFGCNLRNLAHDQEILELCSQKHICQRDPKGVVNFFAIFLPIILSNLEGEGEKPVLFLYQCKLGASSQVSLRNKNTFMIFSFVQSRVNAYQHLFYLLG